MSVPLPIYIGYDEREPVAYHVACHSILRRASIPISLTPLVQSQLRKLGVYTRPRTPTESTSFSMTRFLVPWLCDYAGWALFADSDILCLTDIAELWKEVERQPGKAVYVCQHDYTPAESVKMDGYQQTVYPRKNWSSVMLFDCAKCLTLTPEFVNSASGLELHRFYWPRMLDQDIGSLPLEWNVLVGEPNQTTRPPKMLHYTNGGPWFADYTDCPFSDEWFREHRDMQSPPIVGQQSRASWMVNHGSAA